MEVPSQRLASWLKARATVSQDLYLTDKISFAEYNRLHEDAELNRYTGPLQFLDGTTADEWTYLEKNRIRARAKPRPQ